VRLEREREREREKRKRFSSSSSSSFVLRGERSAVSLRERKRERQDFFFSLFDATAARKQETKEV